MFEFILRYHSAVKGHALNYSYPRTLAQWICDDYNEIIHSKQKCNMFTGTDFILDKYKETNIYCLTLNDMSWMQMQRPLTSHIICLTVIRLYPTEKYIELNNEGKQQELNTCFGCRYAMRQCFFVRYYVFLLLYQTRTKSHGSGSYPKD